MKCIKRTDTHEILRLPEAQAKKLTASGQASYCSKKEWKEAGRKGGVSGKTDR